MMRRGVALLLTLVVVMLMTITIGWSIHTLSEAKKSVEKERLMIQSAIFIEDVLGILKNSPEINAAAKSSNPAALFALLGSASMLPFESHGYKVLISLKSARDKININTFSKNATKKETLRRKRLADFLRAHGLGDDLYYYILDAMSGFKADGSYKSDLFYNDPELYRNAIVSPRQMEKILLVYAKKDGIDPFSKLDFDKIFSYDEDANIKLDLNYATPEVWEFVAGVSQERAAKLAENAGAYQNLNELGLNEEQKKLLSLFEYSFFEPVITVHIDIFKEDITETVEFEYDIKKKKAKRFVFEIQN